MKSYKKQIYIQNIVYGFVCTSFYIQNCIKKGFPYTNWCARICIYVGYQTNKFPLLVTPLTVPALVFVLVM